MLAKIEKPVVIPPESTIWCNHRGGEYILHQIIRKLGSIITSTVVTLLVLLTDYISGADNYTLWVLLVHNNGNIEMLSISPAAMMTMVAAATIHDDVIKWKHFPRNWPFVRGITGPGEFPTQRPVTRSFDVYFDLRLNKRLSKQPWGWWFETPSWSLWRQRNACGFSQWVWRNRQLVEPADLRSYHTKQRNDINLKNPYFH